MKELSIKSLSVVFGAIALIAILFSLKSQAEEANCSEQLGGIQLNERQAKDYQQLEKQLETTLKRVGFEYERRLDALLPSNSTPDPKTEAAIAAATAQHQTQVNAAQESFDRGLKQILTPAQRQQLERQDATCNFADT